VRLGRIITLAVVALLGAGALVALGPGGRQVMAGAPRALSGERPGAAGAEAGAGPGVASAAWNGGRGALDAQPGGGASRSPGSGEVRAGEPSGDPGEDPSSQATFDPELEPERAEQARYHDAMRRVVSDLEFNRGLPEPIQQAVRPSPPAWTPDPAAEQEAAPEIDAISPARAPANGGVRVTIRGRYLHPAQVMFGQAPAAILAQTSEAVTVLAPPARAGAVQIAVTNVDGNFVIARATFVYD
jgi:hypothetical protein